MSEPGDVTVRLTHDTIRHAEFPIRRFFRLLNETKMKLKLDYDRFCFYLLAIAQKEGFKKNTGTKDVVKNSVSCVYSVYAVCI